MVSVTSEETPQDARCRPHASNVDEDREHSEELDSSDEALCEMLGLPSLETGGDETETDDDDDVMELNKEQIDLLLKQENLRETYERESICLLPPKLAIPSSRIRRLTDELVWGGDNAPICDRTYETVTTICSKIIHRNSLNARLKDEGETSGCDKEGDCVGDSGAIVEESQKRVLTRLENFVSSHNGWSELCNGYLQKCVSSLLGTDMTLFKEKLNLKPPGGSGFAPHCDTPSLRMPFGKTGPQQFTTVMVAIDNMTRKNGCLGVVRGCWSEDNHYPVVIPSTGDSNPDGDGRAGAVLGDPGEYEDIECRSGDIVIFNGWAPHRSGANTSLFPRRAVFLTYNATVEGDYHALYYIRMKQLRNDYKTKWRIEQQEKMTT